MELNERTVAVVTGAASGIGRAVAVALGRRGAPVALVDVDSEGLVQTAALLAGRASVHTADVSDRARVAALPAEVLAAHGSIAVLVNNAGVAIAAPFERQSLDDFAWLMGVNFWGAVHACHAFLPQLRAAGRGHIAQVLSDFALVGFPGKTAYCASKFALAGFSQALAAELHGSGVGLTCVYPGPVDTNLIRRSRAAEPAKRDAEAAFVAARGMPVERVGERIVRAIERGAARVRIGKETLAIDWATRAFPRLTGAWIGRFKERIAFV